MTDRHILNYRQTHTMTDRQTDTSVLIQLLTKFGEDRMKFQDRPTDDKGVGVSIVVCQSRESVLRLVSMKETHWKTMRILGIKQRIIVNMNEPHWKTMRILGIKPLWKTMRISGISTDRESVLSRKSPESVLSIVSRVSVLSKPGISTDTVQPTRNKRISRSAAARRNESMPLCGGKLHFAVKLRICPRRHAAICNMMPSRCAS
ncbi:hypothetical protein DPMN_003785 [Dreissena polymorpha]|uniref:Uncharacterized protein n=1 Tax=Dreissena polymorpha TaxID=45954 RepID=A0A9D4MP27_DREPO|nr:hypothetical protein DPMN_003785 [Dreissena polymorpha]